MENRQKSARFGPCELFFSFHQSLQKIKDLTKKKKKEKIVFFLYKTGKEQDFHFSSENKAFF